MHHPLVGPPAATLFAPTAYGAEQGTFFAGLGAVNRWPGDHTADGFALAGFGLGDADRYFALQTTAIVDDLGFREDHFGHNGTVGFQLWRWINSNTAIAIGAANAIPWGPDKNIFSFKRLNASYYGVLTHIFNLRPHSIDPLPLTTSVGYGTGAYGNNVFTHQKGNESAPFVSAALRIIPKVSLIGDYTDKIVSTGISVVPLLRYPFMFSVYATNIAGSNRAPGPVTYGALAGVAFQLF